jgi:tRNA(fMet)-specific endonuclease VapC
MRYLLDANAVIALLHDVASKAAERARRTKPGDVALSAIVAHEAGKGTPIGPYDALIAGQAIARDLTLAAHNTEGFRRVPGLRIEDWQG